MNTKQIQKEIALLKSFAISLLGQDKKNKYNPKFVKEILEGVSDKPVATFKNKASFLKLLNS